MDRFKQCKLWMYTTTLFYADEFDTICTWCSTAFDRRGCYSSICCQSGAFCDNHAHNICDECLYICPSCQQKKCRSCMFLCIQCDTLMCRECGPKPQQYYRNREYPSGLCLPCATPIVANNCTFCGKLGIYQKKCTHCEKKMCLECAIFCLTCDQIICADHAKQKGHYYICSHHEAE